MIISTDKELLDIKLIHAVLKDMYWARGRTLEEVKTTIDHCLCFGVYEESKQIGFARVLTDYAVFAYLMDVFILPEFRGRGYAKALMKEIFNNQQLRNLKWMLKTSDAHSLYEKFGFVVAQNPEKIMERLQDEY
jgi:GNAT superfamily N-acetyltransferase